MVHHIIRTIVLSITILAGLSSVYYGYIIGSRAIETEWRGYCAQYHAEPTEQSSCMMLAFKLIDRFKRLLIINLAIAITLPGLLFTGERLLRRFSPSGAKGTS